MAAELTGVSEAASWVPPWPPWTGPVGGLLQRPAQRGVGGLGGQLGVEFAGPEVVVVLAVVVEVDAVDDNDTRSLAQALGGVVAELDGALVGVVGADRNRSTAGPEAGLVSPAVVSDVPMVA